MVDQRDFLAKNIMRKGYFVNDDGTDAGHVIVRVNHAEHPDYPTGKKGFTRGIEHCVGQVIKPAPEIEGCVIESINYKDLTGKVPEMIVDKAVTKAPLAFYEGISKFAKK